MNEDQEKFITAANMLNNKLYEEEALYKGVENVKLALCSRTNCTNTQYCERGYFYPCELRTAWVNEFLGRVSILALNKSLLNADSGLQDLLVKNVLNELTVSTYFKLSPSMHQFMNDIESENYSYGEYIAILYFVLKYRSKLQKTFPADVLKMVMNTKTPLFVKITVLDGVAANKALWPISKTDELQFYIWNTSLYIASGAAVLYGAPLILANAAMLFSITTYVWTQFNAAVHIGHTFYLAHMIKNYVDVQLKKNEFKRNGTN